MALTLSQIRDYVYEHLELDPDDVPVNLIDTWATEGFLRIVKALRRWPYYQDTATITTTANQQVYTRADDLNGLRTIAVMTGPNGQLRYMHQQDASDAYFRAGVSAEVTGRPDVYSEWGDNFYLWPTPNDVFEVEVLGYREPVVFGSDAGATPDLPDQFHQLVRSWVLYRAFLHQDDTELAEIEKVQFTEILDMMISEETRDDGAQPMIYGGSRKTYRLPRELRADYTTWS